MPTRIKIEEKLVTEVKERVIVHTRIVERPDGTKETIIDEKRDTDSKSEYSKVMTPLSLYSVRVSSSANTERYGKNIYTVGVERHLILGLSAGLYARSDKELGVTISYSF